MHLFIKSTINSTIKSIFIVFISLLFFAGAYWYSSGELDAADKLAEEWIIVNNMDQPENYNLDQNVLRQEIAAVARWIAGIDIKTTCDNIFDDVSETSPNDWACFSVEALVDADLIAENPSFNPERDISKAEALGMMINAAGLDYTYDSSTWVIWQEQIVSFASATGIVDSFSDYNTLATRWWVFDVAVKAMDSDVLDDSNNEDVLDEDDETSDETSDEKEFSFDSYSETIDGVFSPKFSLKNIEVNKWDTVTLKITNINGVHDFVIDEYDISESTPLNEEVVIEFVADEAGDFIYYCSMPWHRDAWQWWTLTVVDM